MEEVQTLPRQYKGNIKMIEQKQEGTSSALQKWEDSSERELVKVDTGTKVLTFLLANEEYAIDILIIDEITRPIAVTYVPRVPPYIRGIINLRGQVIPILNLHLRLGLSTYVPGNKNRFIICRTESTDVGIVADKVNDVVHVEKHQLQPPPAKISASGSGFVKNIGRIGERILIILDIEKILQIDRK